MLIQNTGNRKLDEAVTRAALRYPHRDTKLHNILHSKDEEKRPDIPVGDKALRTYHDGTVFASVGELERWDYLLKIQMLGGIKDLRRQVEFLLQESFIHKQWGDIPAVVYVADFVYTNITFRKQYPGRECVEDSKGGRLSDIYKFKRKLFLYRYGGYLFFEVLSNE